MDKSVKEKSVLIIRLRDLPGVEREYVDSCLISNIEDIGLILDAGYACSVSKERGAFDIWKDDAGMFRGERMYYRTTMEQRTFSSYEEMIECVKKWFEIIKER